MANLLYDHRSHARLQAQRAGDATLKLSPPASLFLLGFIVCVLIIPGSNLPVSDYPRRLGVAHWLWTGAPPLTGIHVDDQAKLGGVPGRGGVRHPWFGIGQSLLLLPADFAVTQVTRRFPSLAREAEAEFQWRSRAVAYLFFPALNGCVVVAAFYLLAALGFDARAASLGALFLLVGTTLLWHVQNNQENGQELLCYLLGSIGVLSALRPGRRTGAVFAGFAALGFGVVTRLPDLLDLCCAAAMAPLAVLFGSAGARRRERLRGAADSARLLVLVGLPVTLLSLAVDRLYHWWRFGSWWGTYMQLYGAQARAAVPSLPASFPWNGSLLAGALGPFLALEKSIFLFDPLLLVTVGIAVARWSQLVPRVRAFVAATLCLLGAKVAAYARFYDWGGNASWGDRYLTVPVHALCLLAVPLALALWWPRASRWRRRLALLALAGCIGLQALSLVWPCWYEDAQAKSIHAADWNPYEQVKASNFVIGRRLRTALGLATGRFAAWHLDHDGDGRPLAPPPNMLLIMLPLHSLPRAAAVAAKALWAALLALALWLAWRLLAKPAGDVPAMQPRGAP